MNPSPFFYAYRVPEGTTVHCSRGHLIPPGGIAVEPFGGQLRTDCETCCTERMTAIRELLERPKREAANANL